MAEISVSDFNDNTLPMWKRAGLQAPLSKAQTTDDEFFSNLEKPTSQPAAQRVGDEDFFRQLEEPPASAPSPQTASGEGGGVTAPSPNQRISQAAADIKGMPEQSPRLGAALKTKAAAMDPSFGGQLAYQGGQLWNLVKAHPEMAGAAAAIPIALTAPEAAIMAVPFLARAAWRAGSPLLRGYAMAKGAKMALGPELGEPLGQLLQHLLP